MKIKIFALLALVMVAMTASAYELKVGTSAHGKVTFIVGSNVTTEANKNDVVTVSIALENGFVVSDISNKVYSEWEQADAPRRTSISVQDKVEMTKVDDTTWTFIMPKANVEINVDYIVHVDTDVEETQDETKVVTVQVDMEVVPGTTPTVDPETGDNVYQVVVEGVEIPAQTDATASNPKELTIAVEPSVKVGNNVFVVTAISKDAFKSTEPTAIVTKVVMPETPVAIPMEDGALEPDGTPIELTTPLSMLDDYALMNAAKKSFEANKVSATAIAPDRYWTFSSGVDVLVPEGVSVYRAFMDGVDIRILPIDEANEAKIIKANNGVLLACDSKEGGNAYEMVANPSGPKSGTPVATTDAKSYAGNDLEPVIEAKNYAADQYLIMKGNKFHTIANNGSKVPACKAVFSKAKANQ